MITSLRWLNDYLSDPVDADTADRVLTIAGFPLEGREDVNDDIQLDFEVTSNRGDCLSHVGLARELAAALAPNLTPPDITLSESDTPVESLASVENLDTDLCPLYSARVITGVTVAPSPDWLTQRLEAVGLRPVNNVVDITNFVMLELGQPLHAFDLNKLNDKRIVVRRAQAGENFTAIDATKHKLSGDMLVIADASNPVAVAGVMGGLDSEVADATTDILLESAIFAPLSVRNTSRALKLASDSSFRFERKVDPLGVERASQRAAQLICQLAGGSLARGVIRVGTDLPDQPTVDLRPARCNQLLGVDIPNETMLKYLDALELTPVLSGDTITCTIPTHRNDLTREVDLIEEVARLYGFDQIPIEPTMQVVVRSPQSAVLVRTRLSQTLVAHGYHEAVTFNFISESLAAPFLPAGATLIRTESESRKAEPYLQPSTLPALLACRKTNQDAGNTNVRLYESASVFWRSGDQLIEHRRLGLISDLAPKSPDIRALRGTIEELTHALLGPNNITFEPISDPRFGAGAQITLRNNGAAQPLGIAGILAPNLQDTFDLQTPVGVAELDLDLLLDHYPPLATVADLPRFPGIERDLSLVLDESVRYSQIEAAVSAADPALLTDTAFVGVYRGKQVGPGKKSVTIRLTFRDPDKTLRHDEVDPQVQTVVTQLKADLAAELRV